ncbi:MAG: FlgO family outer membrane protein, partial [Gemmatimonadaceae bacterium]
MPIRSAVSGLARAASTVVVVGMLLPGSGRALLRAQYPDVPPPPPCKPSGRDGGASPATGRANADDADDAARLALLPFQSLSVDDPAAARFAYALSQRVAERIRDMRPVEATSRTVMGSVDPSATSDIKAVGSALRARYVLAGTIARTERGMLVTVRLLRGRDGSVAWQSRFERATAALPALEAEIARAVATRAFDGDLAKRGNAGSALTANGEAYRHFLQAESYFAERTPQSLGQAVAQYDTATTLDPRFATAWSRLALAYAVQAESGAGSAAADSQLVKRGLGAADRAATVDPASSDAWVARAMLLERQNPRAFPAVRAAFERAIRLDPRNAEAHRRYGRALMVRGETTAADRELRAALDLEPDLGGALVARAEMSFYAGRYGDACYLLNAAITADYRFADAYALRARARLPLREVRYAYADAEVASRLGNVVAGDAMGVVVAAAARDTVSARTRAKRLLQSPLVAGRRPLAVKVAHPVALAL